MIKNKVILLFSSMVVLTLFNSANNSTNNIVNYSQNRVISNRSLKYNLNDKVEVFWTNPDPSIRDSWSTARSSFALVGTDPLGTCFAQFSQEYWNIIKNETFYLDCSFDFEDNIQVRLSNNWWGVDKLYDSSFFTKNSDGTWALSINLENTGIKDQLDIDNKYLAFIFVGSSGSIVRMYTKKSEYKLNNNNKEVDKLKNNGYLELDKATSTKGETCTINVNALAGYTLKENSLKVAYGNPEQTCVITQPDPSKDWIYTFIMPDTDVTVSAEFIQKVTPTPPQPQPASGIPKGPLIGIILGSEVGAALILILFTFVFSKPKK